MNPILRLLRYAIPYRGRLVAALLAMAVYAAASGLLAMLIKPIIDDVLPSRERLGFVAAMLVACYVFKGLGSYASVYLMTDVGQRLVRDVRNELFGNIVDQSAGFFSRRTTGQLMSRLTNDVSRVQHVVSETVGDLVRELLAVLVYAGLLFYYDARLALVCLTGAPLIVYPLVRIGQRVRRTTRRSQEELEVLSHISAEAFTGHRIVKAFGAERHERRKFADAAHRLFRTNMKVTSSLAALPPVMELLGGLLAAGLLWYASREITTGQMTPGDFTAFLAILFLSYGPIRKLSPRQCQCPASDRGVGTDLRDPRYTYRGGGPGRREAARDDSGRHRVPQRELCVRTRRRAPDLAPRVVHRGNWSDGGHRGVERCGQDDPGQPDPEVLRRHRRWHLRRWDRPPRCDPSFAAGADWHRHAGHRAVR